MSNRLTNNEYDSRIAWEMEKARNLLFDIEKLKQLHDKGHTKLAARIRRKEREYQNIELKLKELWEKKT